MSKVNPTRMELTRLKKKLITAKRGHKLLKDKRDELMRRFLELVRLNMELRQNVEKGLFIANQKFVLAKAMISEPVLNTALLADVKPLKVEVSYKNVMSVLIPEFKYETKRAEDGIYPYGPLFTSEDLDYAIDAVNDVFDEMLRLSQVEKSCQLMADEIEKTRRRVNALEHTVIPETEENIRYVTMKLDENERSTQVRLVKVKDIMIKKRLESQG